MSEFKVAIVGAGLSGSLLANGLLNGGVDFTVYEAAPSVARDDDENYQIRLGAPALAGFKRCLSPQQLAQLLPMFGRSGGMLSTAPILYDHALQPLLDLTRYPVKAKTAPIDRAALREFLAAPLEAAGRIKYSKRLTGFEVVQRAQRRKVRLIFDNSTEAECDLLITAEGSQCKVPAIPLHRDQLPRIAR